MLQYTIYSCIYNSWVQVYIGIYTSNNNNINNNTRQGEYDYEPCTTNNARERSVSAIV